MSTAPETRTSTGVRYVVQGAMGRNGKWDPWGDMPDYKRDANIYDAIGKAELFHYFMEHGTYPAEYLDKVNQNPGFQAMLAEMQHVHAVMMQDRKKGDTYEFRTRVVERTVVKTITDKEIDPAMLVQHGAKT